MADWLPAPVADLVPACGSARAAWRAYALVLALQVLCSILAGASLLRALPWWSLAIEPGGVTGSGDPWSSTVCAPGAPSCTTTLYSSDREPVLRTGQLAAIACFISAIALLMGQRIARRLGWRRGMRRSEALLGEASGAGTDAGPAAGPSAAAAAAVAARGVGVAALLAVTVTLLLAVGLGVFAERTASWVRDYIAAPLPPSSTLTFSHGPGLAVGVAACVLSAAAAAVQLVALRRTRNIMRGAGFGAGGGMLFSNAYTPVGANSLVVPGAAMAAPTVTVSIAAVPNCRAGVELGDPVA